MLEVEGYTEASVVVINIRPQGIGGEPPLAVNPAHTRSSIGMGALTNGA